MTERISKGFMEIFNITDNIYCSFDLRDGNSLLRYKFYLKSPKRFLSSVGKNFSYMNQNGDIELFYVADINKYTQCSSIYHNQYLKSEPTFQIIEDIRSINPNNLYYFGLNTDYLIRDHNWRVISSEIVITELHIYRGDIKRLQTPEEANNFLIKAMKFPWILEADIRFGNNQKYLSVNCMIRILMTQDLFDLFWYSLERSNIDGVFRESVIDYVLNS